MSEARSPLVDTRTAFRFESTPNLLLRLATFFAMGVPWLNALAQRLAVSQVGNPLGRFVVGFGFDLFLGGTDLRGCRRTLDHLQRYGSKGILDYMAEGAPTEPGRDAIARELRRTLEFCARNDVPFAACKPSGLMDLEVLRKVQAGAALDEAEARRYAAGRERLAGLCQLAEDRGVQLFVDAEWCYMQGAADELVEDLMRRHNRRRPVVFTTVQMYRKDRLAYLEGLLEEAARDGWILAVKLVRGAYMEFERENTRPDPIHPDIDSTHAAYDAAVEACLDAIDRCALVVATHNRRSVEKTLRGMAERHLEPSDPRVAFAQLFGMSDHLTFNVARLGGQALKYLPYGPLEEAVPYLVRRAQENSAISRESAREQHVVRAELWRRLVG